MRASTGSTQQAQAGADDAAMCWAARSADTGEAWASRHVHLGRVPPWWLTELEEA